MNPDTLSRICERIEDGELTEEAAQAEGITARTLRRWVAEDDAASVRYMRARSIAADALAEESVRIAKGDGARRYADSLERRLAYDALRWLAGRRRPKEYADRPPMDERPASITVNVVRVGKGTPSAPLPTVRASARLAGGTSDSANYHNGAREVPDNAPLDAPTATTHAEDDAIDDSDATP